jgi:hypothetical protein
MENVRAAGYNDVQIVQFPSSPFHSVCVGKFVSRKEAEALKRKLEGDSIAAFVRYVPKVQ